MKTFNTPKLKFLYRLFITFLILFSIYRLMFLFFFNAELTTNSKNLLFESLFMGFRFDARLAAALLLPAFILINLPINPKFKHKLVTAFYSLMLGLINFLYIIDAGYFSYLKARMNATIISFLKNPIISFQMVQQSYPWLKISILFFILSITTFFIIKIFITPVLDVQKIMVKKKVKITRIIVFLFIFAISLYGSVKAYPLRWSEAFQSTDSFSSNLSLNPILYVFDTYSFRASDYDEKLVRENYNEVSNFLGVQKPDLKTLNFLREYPGDENRQKNHPNIVIVIMESLAYYKTGLGGSKVNPTPYLDKLAEESILFNHFYTPTVATARSVFAAITSLPDISKVQTGTRNPFIVDQNTIMGQANAYDKFYFLGGSANWGNIRGVLSYNIPQLKISEEGSYKSPRVDVWGISDLDLFKEAVQKINDRGNEKPFMAIIQSAGFHRPYTISEGVLADGFKILNEKDIDPKLVTQYGFESLNEFNAMRLQDYSLGRFIEIAKKNRWYENTIFMIIGDHGLTHNNALNVPEWSKFNANGYHVPLIIHSPKYVQSGVNSKIGSEMDLMPTAAGLMGIPYKTRAFGRDLFNPAFDNYRAAFSYNWYAPFHITLVDSEFYFEYIPYNGNSQMIKYNEIDNTQNIKDKFVNEYQQREKLTRGLYETAKYLLYHNPKTY